MTNHVEFIQKRLREREVRSANLRAQIAQLRAALNEVDIEIKVYKDVLKNTSPDELSKFQPEIPKNNSEAKSRISDNWKAILQAIGKHYPESLNTETIRDIAREINPEINDDTLRSQLSVYTSRGFLERTSVGNYRLSEAGASSVGYALAEQSAAPTN